MAHALSTSATGASSPTTIDDGLGRSRPARRRGCVRSPVQTRNVRRFLHELARSEGGPALVEPRASPTEPIRAEIHELFAGDGDLTSTFQRVARLSVHLTFQSILDEILCKELGPDVPTHIRPCRRGSPAGHMAPRYTATGTWVNPRRSYSALAGA